MKTHIFDNTIIRKFHCVVVSNQYKHNGDRTTSSCENLQISYFKPLRRHEKLVWGKWSWGRMVSQGAAAVNTYK